MVISGFGWCGLDGGAGRRNAPGAPFAYKDPRRADCDMVSNTRAYGAAIAVTSGAYSLWSATGAPATLGGSLMLAVGLVVLAHGLVLLTPYVDRIAGASGFLMIGYAIVMLAIQGLFAAGMMRAGGMRGGMSGSSVTSGMGWDAGMVALAVLMLVSGLVMTPRGGENGASVGM